MTLNTPAMMLLLSVAAITLCAACGDDDPSTENASATPVETSQTEEAPTQRDALTETISLDNSPIRADDALDAQNKLRARDEQRRRVAYETGQSISPQILDVSWPYGTCRDAASLIPPPRKGWHLTALPPGEWPLKADQARITYNGGDTESDAGADNRLSIYVSSGTNGEKGMADIYASPQLAASMLTDGPRGYPVRKTPPGFSGRSVLLGDYLVQLDGNGPDIDTYFEQIIDCGIQNDLIADGVSRSQLTD